MSDPSGSPHDGEWRHHLVHAELSDLIIDYDAETGQRRPVRVDDVVALLEGAGHWRSVRLARRLPTRGEFFDEDGVDGILLRSHLELQRLAEEIRLGQHVARLLLALRNTLDVERFVVVDVGCGLGYVIRHLAESGALGPEAELIGVDYNRSLLGAAQRLAELESLPCRFIRGNAFDLDLDATVFISSGVIHHFAATELADFFARQRAVGAQAVMHFDVAPSRLSPIGAWLFHWARMREPLARHDGVRSALRAHLDDTLVGAIRDGVPEWTPMLFDATTDRPPWLNVMRPIIGMDPAKVERFRDQLGPLGDRLRVVTRSPS